MTITLLPSLDRTSPTFKAGLDALFLTLLPAFIVEMNAAVADVIAKQGIASGAASNAAGDRLQTGLDRIQTGQDRTQTGLDRIQTGQDRAAAAASALTAAMATAFSTANPIAYDATDPSKRLKVILSGLATGTDADIEFTKDGIVAMMSDLAELVRARTYFDNTTSQVVNYLLGGRQRCAPASGAKTFTFTNWPASGIHAVQFLEIVNAAAGGIPAFSSAGVTATYTKFDGTSQTTAALAGITWQTSGTDYIMVETRNGGANLIISFRRG